jgi:hypothetical protein
MRERGVGSTCMRVRWRLREEGGGGGGGEGFDSFMFPS